MPFEIFPARMQSVKASVNESLLLAFRITAITFLLLELSLLFITEGINTLSVRTWYICLALIFEIFALLSYMIPSLDKVACLLFVVAWPIVGTIGIYLFSLSILLYVKNISNFTPMALLLVDYLLNRIDFVREQFIFTLILFVVILTFVIDSLNIPQKTMSENSLIVVKCLLFVMWYGIAELSRFAKYTTFNNRYRRNLL